MAKQETYVALRIGYQDFIMTLDQGQAVQRALVGAMMGNTCYSSSPHLLWGCKQVDCTLRILEEQPTVAPAREEVQLNQYVACREAAYKLDSDAPFSDYETWKKEVV